MPAEEAQGDGWRCRPAGPGRSPGCRGAEQQQAVVGGGERTSRSGPPKQPAVVGVGRWPVDVHRQARTVTSSPPSVQSPALRTGERGVVALASTPSASTAPGPGPATTTVLLRGGREEPVGGALAEVVGGGDDDGGVRVDLRVLQRARPSGPPRRRRPRRRAPARPPGARAAGVLGVVVGAGAVAGRAARRRAGPPASRAPMTSNGCGGARSQPLIGPPPARRRGPARSRLRRAVASRSPYRTRSKSRAPSDMLPPGRGTPTAARRRHLVGRRPGCCVQPSALDLAHDQRAEAVDQGVGVAPVGVRRAPPGPATVPR